MKQAAKTFLQLAGTGKVEEAFEKFVSADFIHHNQYFEESREALVAAMTEAHEASPNELVKVKKCYTDGDTIITHSLVRKADMDIVVIHIFRFENEQIVELWDVGQVALKNSPNSIGHF